jgi:signal transduction histidine kinase
MAVQTEHTSERSQPAWNAAFLAETTVLAVPTITLLIWNAGRGSLDDAGQLIAWGFAIGVLSLMEIPTWRGQPLVPDVPILIAMAVAFPPLTAATIAFISSCNLHEFGSSTSAWRGLNNRANTAIGVACASAASHAITPHGAGWGLAAAVSIALLVWTVENYGSVAIGVAFLLQISFPSALRRLSPGNTADYAIVVVGWWVLALLLAVSYDTWGFWSLGAFVLLAIPLRQALARGEAAVLAEQAAEAQRQVASALSERILEERREERLRLAAGLHDEVIPCLFELSLLGRVLEHDLQIASLESIEADVRSLRHASDEALTLSRQVIHGLRSNPLGPNGLATALDALCAELEGQAQCRVQSNVGTLPELSEMRGLVVYQVAREALANAVRHSKATLVSLRLFQDQQTVILSVEDNGIGFTDNLAAPGHFGLLIMKERTGSVGGSIYIDSTLGRGTQITASFPATD